MRLFIGVPLEGQPAREVGRFTREIRLPGNQGRLVPSANLHCTVRFLGEVNSSRLDEVKAWLAAQLKGFTPDALELDKPGFFRQPTQTILWIGLRAPWLAEAAQRLGGVVAGVPSEKRPFVPHVTVARCRTAIGPVWDRFLEQYAASAPNPVAPAPGRLVLYRSEAGATGPVYHELGSWPG